MAIDDAIDKMKVPGKPGSDAKPGKITVVNKSLQDMKYATDWQEIILNNYLQKSNFSLPANCRPMVASLIKFDSNMDPHIYIQIKDLIKNTKEKKYTDLWQVLSRTVIDKKDLNSYIDFPGGHKTTNNNLINGIIDDFYNHSTIKKIVNVHFSLPVAFSGLLIEHGKEFAYFCKTLGNGKLQSMNLNLEFVDGLNTEDIRVRSIVDKLMEMKRNFTMPLVDYIQEHGSDITKSIKELEELDKELKKYNGTSFSQITPNIRQFIFKRLSQYNPNLIYRGKK